MLRCTALAVVVTCLAIGEATLASTPEAEDGSSAKLELIVTKPKDSISPRIVYMELGPLIPEDDAYAALREDRADIVRFFAVRPLSACDNAQDCARAMDRSCEAVDSDVQELSFNQSTKTCSATCADGHRVQAVCRE